MKDTPFKKVEISKIETTRFIMSPVELKEYIDFDVKRIYFITEPKDKTGAHCHLVEEEFFIMVQGKATMVIDQGNGIEEFQFTGPTSGAYVGNYIWHHFKNFSDDAVLLALSSTNYSPDRSDYIEDYDDYLKVRDQKLKELYG